MRYTHLTVIFLATIIIIYAGSRILDIMRNAQIEYQQNQELEILRLK